MYLPAPVLLSLSISPLGFSAAPSRAGQCVALSKGRSKRTGGGGGFGAKPQRPGGGGGFGAQPPSLEEVVAGFKTRLPEDANVDCPCGSGVDYQTCCQPCHAGLQSGEGYPMESPEACLRCRFSAFAYRLPLPIIATTHSDNRDYRSDRVAWARMLNRDGMFDDFRFVRLEAGPSPSHHPNPSPCPGPCPDPCPGPCPGPCPDPCPGPSPGTSPGPGPGPSPGTSPSPNPSPSPSPNPNPYPNPNPNPHQVGEAEEGAGEREAFLSFRATLRRVSGSKVTLTLTLP
jgi:hypothetical protein